MGIKVKAIIPGLYGHYRHPGAVFEISDEKHFHESWMERLDAEGKPAAAKKDESKAAGKAKAKSAKAEEKADAGDSVI